MATPAPTGMGFAREVRNTDYVPRTTPVLSLYCFRLVPDYHYKRINYDWECGEYVKYEANMDPQQHFHLRESRRSADRARRTALWVGILTIAAVLLSGAVSAIVAVLN